MVHEAVTPGVEETPEWLCRDGALTLRGASEFTGLGRTRLYELIGSGRLRSVRVGNRRLIPRRALVALLAEGLE